MLMWIIILALLLMGLALMVVELIFIPGTSVVGFLGLIFTIAGIVICYRHFGNLTGHYVLGATAVISTGFIIYAFRSGAWTRFSLKSSIDSKVNENLTASLQVGDVGVTTSTLRPFGKAEFASQQYEVKTSGNYVETGTPIRIQQISSNLIIVEPTNN
jgi:membrane-bound ClpP family serine protease